jgi:hypothetical protein
VWHAPVPAALGAAASLWSGGCSWGPPTVPVPSRLFLISSRVEWVEGNGIFAEGGCRDRVWRAREKGLVAYAGSADVAGEQENVYPV